MAAATLTAAMAAVYALVIRAQDGESAAVVVVLTVLIGSAVSIAYGARPDVPHRRLALVAGGAVLLAAGVLSLASIGWPLLLAAVLALTAGLRRPRPTHR